MQFLQGFISSTDILAVLHPPFQNGGIMAFNLCAGLNDEIGKLDFTNRRDAFCGKLGLCAVLKQMKTKYILGDTHVAHPADTLL